MLFVTDPNQQFYGQQPGFNPGYPPQGAPYPPQGFPHGQPGYPPQQPGFPQPGFQQPGFNGMPATIPFHMPPPQTVGSDDGGLKGFEFNDESIRRAFIRKVYSILMVSKTLFMLGNKNYFSCFYCFCIVSTHADSRLHYNVQVS